MKKRSDGRYCKQVLIGYHPDGKRKMKAVYGKTIKEVEKKERELKNLIDCGVSVIESNKITVSEWARKWLKVYKANVEYNTYAQYKNSIEKHIIPAIGDILLSDIKTIQLQQMINELIKNGIYRTSQICQLTVKQFIKQAVNEGLLTRDVSAGLQPIKSETKEKRTLTNFEKEAIKKANLDLRQRVFIDIMRYAGLRRSEALALNVSDIDFHSNSITINKSLCVQNGSSFIKDPKTKASYRTIPMPKILTDEIKLYVKELQSAKLFVMQNGDYMTRSSFNKFWQGIIKKVTSAANFNDNVFNHTINFTPHICRHTYATDLYYSNVDIKTAQYLLGHSSLDMTLSIYTHLDKTKTCDAIKQFNDYLTKQNIG